MKSPSKRRFSATEIFLAVTLLVGLAFSAAPAVAKFATTAPQIKQLNNVKQIGLACQLFATDNSGLYPNGKYDPKVGKIMERAAADSAEACFNDLAETRIIEVEKLYWNPAQTVQCSPDAPDENGTLTAGENCWDYIAGLTNSSSAVLPLVFEASDGGTGTRWTKEGGHPWDDRVIVAFVDGSAERVVKEEDGGLKVEREGAKIDLCIPTPGKNNWPADTKVAPATPAPKE